MKLRVIERKGKKKETKTRSRVSVCVCERENKSVKESVRMRERKSKVVLTKCFNEKNEAIKRLPKRMRICVANRMVRLSVE